MNKIRIAIVRKMMIGCLYLGPKSYRREIHTLLRDGKAFQLGLSQEDMEQHGMGGPAGS